MKNRVIEVNESTATIEIIYKGTSLLCYIDSEDLEKVSSIKGTWHITNNRKGHIDGVRTKVQTDKIRKQIWMHNLVYGTVQDGNVIDHIDHNTLNNRKSNLREIKQKYNAQNISITLNSTTGHRNVTIEGSKFRVRIGGKSFGRYSSFEEACAVADKNRNILFPYNSNLDNKTKI